MLVLSRKCGESIVIPQLGVTLTVLEVRGDRVRLGIAAPENVTIHRHEVWERIKQFQESEEASAAIPMARSEAS